jgi:plasmid stability protein
MATMTIRNIDDALKARLRVRAAVHGKSMEEEAREILRDALSKENATPTNLAQTIRRRIAPLRGVDLPRIPREAIREPLDLDE